MDQVEGRARRFLRLVYLFRPRRYQSRRSLGPCGDRGLWTGRSKAKNDQMLARKLPTRGYRRGPINENARPSLAARRMKRIISGWSTIRELSNGGSQKARARPILRIARLSREQFSEEIACHSLE